MGRWFGYRDKPVPYENLCKIWMLDKTKEYFVEISNSIEELKADLINMYKSKKTPREFGIRVRNESDSLGITDRSKMRTSKKYILSSSLYGEVFETPFISSSNEDVQSNYSLFIEFLKSITLQKEGTRYLANKVKVELIIRLLKQISVHELNQFTYFHKEHIIDFIEKNGYIEFDVGIINGKGENITFTNGVSMNLIERNFDLINESVFRISGNHSKLGGPSDLSLGLTQEQLNQIDEISKKNGKSFLVESRRPIILFYPIKLKVKDSENEQGKEQLESLKIIANKTHDKVKFILGLSIGFPKTNSPKLGSTHTYFINIKSEWMNVMKGIENEDDE
jgi:hypothetical protein